MIYVLNLPQSEEYQLVYILNIGFPILCFYCQFSDICLSLWTLGFMGAQS